MEMSPFSAPFFWGTKGEGFRFHSERLLYGRELCRSGGTGKAEAAKLTGAGIGPSSAQENERQKKQAHSTQ
jgi:hypothetical protein